MKDERLEYCKALIEMMCRENPTYFVELVRAGLRGVESAQAKEGKPIEDRSCNRHYPT